MTDFWLFYPSGPQSDSPGWQFHLFNNFDISSPQPLNVSVLFEWPIELLFFCCVYTNRNRSKSFEISILLFQGCVRTMEFQAHLVYEGKFEELIKRERCGSKKWPISSLVPVLKPSLNPSLLATRKLYGNKFMYLVHHLLGRTLHHSSDCIQRMVVST